MVVALVGTEIGLLSSMVYTLYAVVAILTVLLSSPLLNIVDRKVTPSVQEIERHEREAIQQAAAVRWIEHVLVPTGPPLVTSLTTDGVAPNR